MKLTIEHTLDLPPTGSTPQLAQEVDGKLFQYYLENGKLKNTYFPITYGNYAEFDNWLIEDPKITGRTVSNFGTKTLVGMGAYAFFVNAEKTQSYIKLPINYEKGSVSPEIIQLEDSGESLHYKLTNPELITYDAFRYVFEGEGGTYEFVTYETEGSFVKPYNMEGSFRVRVRGYRDEVQEFSRWSEEVVVLVTARPGWESEESGQSGGASLLKRSVILYASNWESQRMEVTVGDVKSDSVVFISPAPLGQREYSESGIYCVEQGNGYLVFECEEEPENDIPLNIVIYNEGEVEE